MRRSLLVAAFAALMVVLIVVASPAGATPPADVEIVAGFGARASDTFTATGSAVEDGVVCGSGSVEQTYFHAAGFQSNRGVNLLVGKEFTCDDGSGTFSVKLQVRWVFDEGASFRWVITGGTGDYENLQGTGYGAAIGEGVDGYRGGLHLH